jgi:hypothetical protein
LLRRSRSNHAARRSNSSQSISLRPRLFINHSLGFNVTEDPV